MAKGTVHVVSSTHWDREWYCTFEEYRYRLVEYVQVLLDELARNRSYRTFHFDGQTQPLVDHLEIRPQDAPRLKRAVRSGGIVPGPWMVLADEALVSGESLVANLRIGISDCREFGFEGPWVGYVPDQFGHVAQMPQIMRQFGIDAAFMSRGFTGRQLPKGSLFRWRAPDGSEVLALYNDYGNGAWLHNRRRGPLDQDLIRRVVEQHVKASCNGDIILVDGVDHFPPNLKLAAAMKEVAAVTGMKVRHSTLHETMRALRRGAKGKRLPRFDGEIRYDLTAADIDLNCSISSRMYLKQYNRRVESLLERLAEPFAALASVGAVAGAAHPAEMLRHARRMLLLNHPHDSICGCSIDRVHRQMMTRFEEAEEVGQQVFRRAVWQIAAGGEGGEGGEGIFTRRGPEYPGFNYPRHGTGASGMPVALANARPRPVREAAIVPFELPGDWERGEVRAESMAGGALPVQLLSKRLQTEWDIARAERLDWEPFVRPEHAAVLPEGAVGGLGTSALRIVKGRARRGKEAAGDVRAGGNWLDNGLLRARVARDGTVSIRAASGGNFSGLGFLEDGGDCGSGYHYRAPARDRVIRSKGKKAAVAVLERGPLVGVLRATVRMRIPVGLAEGDRARSRATAPLVVRTYYVLRHGCPFLEVRAFVENRSADHRLRAAFPAGLRARTVVTDAQFAHVKHSTGRKPYPEKPQGGFVFVPGRPGAPGLVLMNRGLPEYECTPGGTLYLTLMRSLSFAVRQWWRWVKADDSAMKGVSVYEYALGVARDDAEAARLSEDYALPLAAFAMPVGVSPGEPRGGLLELESGAVRLSTVERSPLVDGAIEVRLFNPWRRKAKGRLLLGFGVRRAEAVGLDGRRLGPLAVRSGRSVGVRLAGGEIATVRLHPAE